MACHSERSEESNWRADALGRHPRHFRRDGLPTVRDKVLAVAAVRAGALAAVQAGALAAVRGPSGDRPSIFVIRGIREIRG
jgi:hypothetical protein